MVQGDRNTAFYHVSTLVRRNRNCITTIKNSVVDWINEEEEVMEFIWKGFCDIYSTSHILSARDPSQNTRWQGCLSNKERDSLSHGVTTEEIKAGLWSLKANKAPGLDGLHVGFFQHFWSLVGESVIQEVKSIFDTKRMPEYLNRMHIVLIQKIQGPETLGNYRPISLYNTMYKIVTKIAVARLKPFLEAPSPINFCHREERYR